jgi:hypothetical protein
MTKLYDRAFACTAEEVERDQLLTVRWAAGCQGSRQWPTAHPDSNRPLLQTR